MLPDVDYREHKSEPQHILHTQHIVRLTDYEQNFRGLPYGWR
jgi:hypothetical protein